MIKLSDSAKSAIEENSEVILDKFANSFLKSDFSEAIGDFPVISSSKGVLSTIYNIRNWRIARNIRYFVSSLQSNQIDQEEYNKLVKKYGREKILENVLLSLEVMRSQKQAIAFACLFNALVTEKISWERYVDLQNIIEKMDPTALDEDQHSQPSYKLVAVGLAYIITVFDGVRVEKNGKLYNDYDEYILKPYMTIKQQFKSAEMN